MEKNLFSGMINCACLLAGIVLGMLAILGYYILNNPIDELYAKTAVVVELNQETDEVICYDANGEEWVFTGIEDWQVNDVCSMVMYTKHTKSIYDDVIIDVKYDGWKKK